jgi:formate dehydrogenase iron-sulfur subunit
MSKAILYDATKCTACRACQVACKAWNGHLAEKTQNQGSYENPPHLSPETWVRIEFREVERNGKVEWLFTRHSCMHCTDASCVTVCPTNAIVRTEEGFVHIDQEWCIGCGNCVQACPFGVPHKDELLGTARKCSHCTEVGLNRVDAGLETACVKTCPTKALMLGDREELINIGRERVNQLKATGYSNAQLYGEKELGGLNTLYVLSDTPDVYGLPVAPKAATADVISKWLSGLVTAGVVAALPLYFVFKRSQQLAESKAKSEGGV